jgi:hypothetical protein
MFQLAFLFHPIERPSCYPSESKVEAMNFERLCGMTSAAMIVLIFAIVMWTGLRGPLWQNIKPGDLLNLSVSVTGWLVTIGIGVRAFVLSQRQIRLGADQIALQQQQINGARLQLRRNTYEQLAAAVTQKYLLRSRRGLSVS